MPPHRKKADIKSDDSASSNQMIELANDIDIKIGEKLKSLREAEGKKQVDIASHLGVSAQQYQKYEKGATKCSLATLYKLAAYYDIQITEILPWPDTSASGFSEEAHKFSADLNEESSDEAAAISKILAIFIRIKSKSIRTKLLALMSEIA